MIYLIGGTPRSGKTTTAKLLARKLKIPWISADTLESVVSSHTKPKEKAKRFPKNAMRIKTKQINDIMYARYSTTQIVNAYIKQARTSWLAIETVVACEIAYDHDFVIEGHQVHPALAARLINKYGKENVNSIFLGRTDASQIIKSNAKYPPKNDWFTGKTKNPLIYPKIAAMIISYGQFFEQEAKKYKFEYINTDKNFTKAVREAAESLRK